MLRSTLSIRKNRQIFRNLQPYLPQKQLLAHVPDQEQGMQEFLDRLMASLSANQLRKFYDVFKVLLTSSNQEVLGSFKRPNQRANGRNNKVKRERTYVKTSSSELNAKRFSKFVFASRTVFGVEAPYLAPGTMCVVERMLLCW